MKEQLKKVERPGNTSDIIDVKVDISLVPRPHPSPRMILKAIRTGVGFGSGTETRWTYTRDLGESGGGGGERGERGEEVC